ncbi:hypothetical protein BDR06DRAFT_975123 [Suillus hirtellus]|nr:hypothetical protein BDR06DRAFT_975123 [Suillus hirtellus]
MSSDLALSNRSHDSGNSTIDAIIGTSLMIAQNKEHALEAHAINGAAPAGPVQGHHHTVADSTGVSTSNGKVIGNEEVGNKGGKTKKKKKVNPIISCEVIRAAAVRKIHQNQEKADDDKKENVNLLVICLLTIMFLTLTESALYFMTLTWGLSNKKHTLGDTSETSHIPVSNKDGDENINEDIDKDAGDDEDADNNNNEEFKEDLSSLLANEIEKRQMQVQWTHTISSIKRPIEAPNLIGLSKEDLDATHKYNTSYDSMMLDTSEFMTPKVEPVPTKPAQVNSKTSITVCKNSKLPKKAKLELASQVPRMNHNIQPKGPIICLHSNFRSTAIALIANFLAASKDNENEDDDIEILLSETGHLNRPRSNCGLKNMGGPMMFMMPQH